MKIHFAKPEDFEEIRDLLKSANLPFEDVENGIGHFVLARNEQRLIGCVGLQICRDDALLRSLAVSDQERNRGLGKALVQEILEYASRLNLQNIYLLTTTAENFFRKHGFVNANRTEAPDAIRMTSEFSSLCPSTAVFMYKEL
ncbi:arsenic resistance N-acetyltransferase ArsN2 [bacterium]|nr:arsenic resistance N-acetyltransferase ArsN2 [bacterium]